jgi:hydrogenase maturation protease
MVPKRIIVLGIGNSILGDDGIGLRIVEDLSKTMNETIDFIQTEEMGFGLLDFLTGYDAAIIVDSVQTGGIPGSIHLFSIRDFKPEQSLSNHYVGLPQLAAMANRLNIKFPGDISVIGIEVKDPYQITMTLSDELKKKYDCILEKVKEEILILSNFQQA